MSDEPAIGCQARYFGASFIDMTFCRAPPPYPIIHSCVARAGSTTHPTNEIAVVESMTAVMVEEEL